MKPHVLVKLLCVSMLVFVLLAVATPTMAFQSSTGLFRNAAKMPALDQANEQAVVRTRYVDVNLAMLPGARGPAPAGSPVLLNLFDNRSVMAVLDHVERKRNGLIWVGSLQGIALSTVNLVTEDNVMVGSINSPDGMYVIRYAGNGVHAIVQIDQSQYPPERYATPSAPLVTDSYTPKPGVAPDTGGSIDVMVVYTPAFVTAAGGAAAANALVDLGISQTNTSYANSGITQRVNLVYKGQVPYTEPGTGTDIDWDTALHNLTDGTGGLSTVPSLRNTYGADVVSLFTNWSVKDFCGLGWYMDTVSSSFESTAFTVVERTCIDGYFSFAHEMGHNMGAHHDWYALTSSDITPYTYAKGRVNLSAQWRTIMAYNSLCRAQAAPFDCTRIQYWSNPGLTYGGASLGVPGGTKSDSTCYGNVTNPACDADNHLVLNNTAYTVANFRHHVTPITTNPVYMPFVSNAATPTPTLVPMPSIMPGYWHSTTTMHEFYVTPDSHYVRNHAVYVSVTGCGNYKIWHTVDVPIIANQYSFTGSFYASGTFNSATTATVTDGLSNFYIPGCGTLNAGPWLRNYTWQNSSQPPDVAARADGPAIASPVPAGQGAEVIPVH